MDILTKSLHKEGHIRLEIKHKGKTEKVLSYKNLITYQGPTVLAKVLTGDLKYRITHIYGEYADAATSGYTAGSLNGLSAAKGDTIDTLRSTPRLTTDAESDIITATHYTSGNNYYNNIVTFTSSWDNVALADNLLVGAGLVCKISNAELLYAHVYFPALLMTIDKEIVCHWSQLFS